VSERPNPEIVNLDDVELDWLRKGSRFQVGMGYVGRTLGLSLIGATLHVVPAGKTAWPYHRHHGTDEMFLVLSGTGEYRVGDRLAPIRAGDCIGAPAGGEAHQIINSSDAELRYIAFDNRARADVCEYPDSGRISLGIAHGNDRQPRSVFEVAGTIAPLEYWDGEDVGE
jgi:uncharacterized cupin superfamily protein